MANCINPDGTNNCFWADYNTETGLYVVVDEPDYLGMKNPKATPKRIRVMQLCGKGRNEWRHGAFMEHNCPEHEAFQVRFDRTERLRKAILERKKKSFTGKTERKSLPEDCSMFDYLTLMMEDSKLAYDWLMDIYMSYGDTDPAAVLDFFGRLNDMNIRGRQIDVIIAQWFAGYPDKMKKAFILHFDTFVQVLKDDPGSVVQCVNVNFDKSDVEEAVTEGASLFGHKGAVG